MKKLLLFYIVFCFSLCIFAKDYPKADFGDYGIKKQSTLDGYQKYVGETVRYIPLYITSGDYHDKELFLLANGDYDKDYTIHKIIGNDDKIIFILKEKNGKTKIKMKVNNNLKYSTSYFNEDFCITHEHSIPLLLIDKLNADKRKYFGKVFVDSLEYIELKDISLNYSLEKELRFLNYTLYNKIDDKIYLSNVKDISELEDIGKQLKNPKFKHIYTVLNIRNGKTIYEKNYTTYTVKNSINKKVTDILSLDNAFLYDDEKIWTATLTKVEKPLNSDVRYGKTKIITEDNLTKYSYIDNYIDMLIYISNQEKFTFSLTNISDNSIKIIWNEAVFVDVDGTISRVIHEGIKYSEKEKDQPATTIIKGAKIIDLAVPTNNIIGVR